MGTGNRVIVRAVGLVAVAAAGILPVVASQPAAAAANCTSEHGVGDVDGDGSADAVYADPAATVSGHRGAGIVQVRYGAAVDADGRSALGSRVATFGQGQRAVGGVAESGDAFGTALAVGRVDSDTCADVVVGSPGEDVGSAVNAGEVHVIFGSAAGLGRGRAGLTLYRGAGLLGGTPGSGDRFGSSVGVEDLAGLSKGGSQIEPRMIAVGAPGQAVGGADRAGAAYIVNVGNDGGPVSARQITEASPGVPGAPEAGDRFGTSLDLGYLVTGCRSGWCQDLVVGAPGETGGAGAIVIVNNAGAGGTYAGSRYASERTRGVLGVAARGDGFGTVLDYELDNYTGNGYLAVGVPGKDVGRAVDAGAVHMFFLAGNQFAPAADQRLAQGVGKGLFRTLGAAESGDRFGSAVMLTEFHGNGFGLDLVVGTPDEDIGSRKDAGVVQTFSARGSPLTKYQDVWSRAAFGVPGAVGAGDHMGAALGEAGGDHLLIGVPDDGTGAVLDLPWEQLSGLGAITAKTFRRPGGSRLGAAFGHGYS